jgi:predicted acylesterase/phospholipase RssA/CRP-like cAMP-binding protein
VPRAELLRNVPILAGLSDQLLERLTAQADEVQVAAGDWLMHEGDEADSMFLVQTGRLEVVDEGPPENVIRVLRRGDVFGELALLAEGRRSASVRALRDAGLLEISRGTFAELIRQAPSFALELTREMGAQLAASRTPLVAAIPPRTIAVIGLQTGATVASVADQLADGLARHRPVVRLSAGELETIARAEQDGDHVVLTGSSSPSDRWTALCLREADLVVAVSTGGLDREWLRHGPALHGSELLVFGPAAPDSMLKAVQPQEVQVVADPARRPAALAATARRIAGKSLGAVFSGGGARALAHFGVLQELRAAGLQIDRFAGVSLGSIMAAAGAAEFPTEDFREALHRTFVAQNPSRDFVLPAYSLIRGGKTRKLLAREFGELRIEELPHRFFCLSCDLVGREAVVHRLGPLVDAIYPSLAVPGVFPPRAVDGRVLVDGGVLDNLPVATMARTGEGPVIAVDVTGQMRTAGRRQRRATARLHRPIRRMLTGNDAEIPRLSETIVRTVTVGSIDTVAAARLYASTVIAPRVDGVGLLEWKAFDRMIELGREAAREALAAEPELCARWGSS